jgi:DnaJ-domain-containing protein 1
MGIWNRLNSVINSYFTQSEDPDLNEAYDELNDYLKGKKTPKYEDKKIYEEKKMPPEELRGYFADLGVPFGAGSEECKTAYKKLLKIHHPDRHAGHEGNFKKATEKSAKINAAYDHIEKWRKQL